MKVTAEVTRSGKWWAIEVPEVPGAFSQARRLNEIQEHAAYAVATALDIEPETVEVELAINYDLASQVDNTRTDLENALAAAQEASANMAQLARDMKSDGLTVREIGTVMGVSHQRAQQLTKKLPKPLAS